MRRVSCLFLVLAASCASSPKVLLRTQQELWLRTERVADGAIERLDELLCENFESTKGAWCVVLLGEWFLVKSDIYGDDDEREVAAHYFKSVTQMLSDQRGRSVEVQREKEAIAAAARDGLTRAMAEPRPSNEQRRWLRSQQASIRSAFRLEPKRARLQVADDAMEELFDALQEWSSNPMTTWCMVLTGEWFLVRASATGDDQDRKAAVAYFENVIALGDAWPEVAAILAAKDGLKRAQAKG